MTNLDVMVTILSEATGKPQSMVRNAVVAGYAFSGYDLKAIGVLDELPEREAQDLLKLLRQDYQAALNWLKRDLLKATPADKKRMALFLRNRQN